jgi:hypothetical protein
MNVRILYHETAPGANREALLAHDRLVALLETGRIAEAVKNIAGGEERESGNGKT